MRPSSLVVSCLSEENRREVSFFKSQEIETEYKVYSQQREYIRNQSEFFEHEFFVTSHTLTITDVSVLTRSVPQC